MYVFSILKHTSKFTYRHFFYTIMYKNTLLDIIRYFFANRLAASSIRAASSYLAASSLHAASMSLLEATTLSAAIALLTVTSLLAAFMLLATASLLAASTLLAPRCQQRQRC